MSARNPSPKEAKDIPSLLTYPFWLKPFVPLVKSYGVPRYGEFDPSLLFAITYIVLFGAMFGDVGHGAVILVLSAFLGGKLNWLRVVGMSAGAVSILFGFLYGSIFGYEELIHPLWQSPLHNAGQMLVLAVYGGVGFICATLLINTYNRLVAGHWLEALFDSTGLTGLAFYLAMVFGLRGVFVGEPFGLLNAGVAYVSILTIAAFKWMESKAGLGERVLVTLIESLETAINLFANTLSFLRVAAFSLNHVALALAIFTMANGMSATGHWLTIVLGNIVIIVLEGGIVAIQALRLMYYEGFSRFFSGDGTEFMPLRVEGVTGKQ
jgi:V/A-type H+-transporting ATPase subunit I